MSNSKEIIAWCLWGILLTACKAVDIPPAYNFSAKEVAENPYGCWIKIVPDTLTADKFQELIAGELICIDTDSLFILMADTKVKVISVNDISHANLYTHKNQTGSYATLTGVFLAPNVLGALAHASEFGGSFLALGIPVAVVGFLQILAEGSSDENILSYPNQASVNQLKLYARFPAGKPAEVNLNRLKLKQQVLHFK